MSTSPLLRIRSLLPQTPVLIGRVISHDDVADTSLIEIPTGRAATAYTSAVQAGSQIVARGRGVAVGSNAYVRNGVVESQAPDQPVVEIVVGRVVSG